ncbi:MAG: glyoxylase-like metal-dependent hydrolase (beta-lactamase superfamily II) [Candidatus Azotimanducaceae bacterium]|jgi:glyoxylase-like metal-dependent hydrolase (beta-lactamase superfamily II)
MRQDQMVKMTIILLALLLSETTMAALDFTDSGPAPGNMRFAWVHGSLSAKANTDVRVQVHRYNEHTYMLRQNPAVHWEAPFMYLLFGEKQVVLLDSGATSEEDYFPLRQTVDALIERWQQANDISDVQLIVLPLGSELSQTEGLGQFKGRANTRVMAATAGGREALMAGKDSISFDLGGRDLTLLKTPGLDEFAITLYDPWTDLMFTGNTFYAGRLVIRNFNAYKDSLKRLVAFSDEQPVKWIMGGRIEMSDYPGVDYRLRSNFRPREHSLQIPASLLREGYDIVHLINGTQDIRIHDEFIVMNGVGRGARDHGWPTYTPERFRRVRLR